MLRLYLYNNLLFANLEQRKVCSASDRVVKKKNQILQEKKINIDALRSEAAGWAELGWGGCSSAQLLFPFAPLSFPCSQLTLPPPLHTVGHSFHSGVKRFKCSQCNYCCAHLRSMKMHQGTAAPPLCFPCASPAQSTLLPVAKGQGGMGGVVLSTEQKVRTRKCTCEEGRTWG